MAAKGNSSSGITIKTWQGFLIIIAGLFILIGLPKLWFHYEDQQAEKVFKSVAQPDWKQISNEKFGNRFCMDACPGEDRLYNTTNVNRDNALVLFKNTIQENGFIIDHEDSVCALKPQGYSSTVCFISGKKGELNLELSLNMDDTKAKQPFVGVSYSHNSYFFGLFHQ